MPSDLHEISRRLESLGAKRPSPSERLEVLNALASKWEGIRVSAARVLLRWGDSDSIAHVRSLLEEFAAKSGCYASAGAVAQALRPHLQANDLEWVIGLCFEQSNRHNCFMLTHLLEAFPTRPTLQVLERHKATGVSNVQELDAAIKRLTFLARASRA